MENRKTVTGIMLTLLAISLIGPIFPNLKVAIASIGSSDNGILVTKWKYSFYTPYAHTEDGMFYGSSPAIADLGVNHLGGEPNSDLEIVTGSDEYANYYPEIPGYTYGIWRAFDSSGFIEWALDTQSDEARSSPNVIDIDGDGNLDIVAGTTSGWVVEAIERTGVFKWTFPSPPQRNGPFAWHSSPAIADLDPTVSGLEVIIGNTFQGFVYALDGDNRDGVNDGITADISWYPVPGGTEGKDWDVLWIYQTGGSIISTPAIGDVDNDGCLEVVIGSADGNIYCLNGRTGLLEWKYTTGGKVDASPALADFELDGDLEVVIGSADGKVYFINGDENGNGIIDASEVTFFSTEGAVYSSAALGDVDNDGNIEVIVGSSDFKVYSFDYNPTTNTVALNWFRATGGPVVSSPALADRTSVGVYDKDWPMFRNNPGRTGFYGPAPSGELDIYVGSDDSYLYLLDGHTGAVIDRFQTYGPIHTSPSVADVDGDEHLEIAFYDWGYDWGYDDTFWLLRDTVSPGFYLNASPDQNTVAQGGDVTYDITASSYNNFADPITFDIFGLPPNTFSTFTPNPATPLPNGSVVTVLRVTTTIDTPPGEYMLFIRGVSGAKERTITVALVTVTGSDFAVDASPSQITISKGQSANFDVSVTSLAGFSSSVTLTVSGTPLSASASFSPNPVIPPPNGMVYSTLTVSTTSATPPGTYNLYVNGTSGSLVRRIPLLYRTLVVLPVHDVAVTNVAPSKTVVGQGYSLNINVTAANQGDYTETFNVTAYANTTGITDGLVGYWRFDEGSGTTAYDSSGNGNTGTLVNGPIWGNGEYGKALDFDGVDDRVQVPDSSLWDFGSGNFAMAAWINTRDKTKTMQIVSAGYGGTTNDPVTNMWTLGFGYNLGWGSGTRISYGVKNGGYYRNFDSDSLTYNNNEWAHVAVVKNGSALYFYFNGASVGSASIPFPSNSNSYLTVGARQWDDFGVHIEFFDGLLDEVKIYDRALSPTEIWAEYARIPIPIQTQTVTLESGASTILTFTWNTTGFAYGNYTISAYATPVFGEINEEDNRFVDGLVLVSCVGDVNGDKKTTISDIVLVIGKFGTTPSSPEWNPNMDIDGNDKVTIGDIVITINNFGNIWT